MKLWTLRWREHLPGVRTGLIEAADLQQAERVGRAFVAKIPRASFISVESAIIADETILAEPSNVPAPAPRVGDQTPPFSAPRPRT